jgi:hypothetical protein
MTRTELPLPEENSKHYEFDSFENMLPSIEVRIHTFTSEVVFKALINAIEELREVYGISVTFELVNESLFSGDFFFGSWERVEAVINVFGSIIEITESINMENIKKKIINEVIKNIGKIVINEESISKLGYHREHPPAYEAVLLN